MTTIKLINENGVIKGIDPDTGEEVPIEVNDLVAGSVDAAKVRTPEAINRELAEITTVADPGVWFWHNVRSAIRHVDSEDKTYVSYVGGDTKRDLVISEIDHNNDGAQIHTAVKEDYTGDDHAVPAIEVLRDGTVLTAYSDHNDDSIFVRRSSHPEDVSSFGAETTLPYSNTHPYLRQLTDERNLPIYLWFCDQDNGGNQSFVKSTDGGSTWRGKQPVVTSPDRVYRVSRRGNGNSAIHFAFSNGTVEDDHHEDVYYAKYENDSLQAANGDRLASLSRWPVPYDSLDTVYDSSDDDQYDAWVWDIAVDDDGNPAIVWAVFPDDHSHQYWYGKYDGSQWQVNKICEAGTALPNGWVENHYSYGVALDPRDPSVVFAAIGDGQSGKIHRYETSDSGRSWAVRDMTGGVHQNARPRVPVNAHEAHTVIWQRGPYVNHQTDGWNTELVSVPERGAGQTTQGATETPIGGTFLCGGSTTVPPGQWTPIDLTASICDKYGFADTSNNRISIPPAEYGLYLIFGSANFQSVQSPGSFRLRANIVGGDGNRLDALSASPRDDVQLNGVGIQFLSGDRDGLEIQLEVSQLTDDTESTVEGYGNTFFGVVRLN